MKHVLIDGKNLLFRAHYAFKELKTSDGRPTSVLHGFMSLLKDIWKVAGHSASFTVVWDGPPPIHAHLWHSSNEPWRRNLWPEYKLNRTDNADKQIVYSQMPALSELLDLIKYCQIGVPGVEADDLIAMASGLIQEEASVHEVLIYSNDRDLFQLLSRRVKLILPIGGGGVKLITHKNYFDVLGYDYKLIAKVKALAGDSSDNYKPLPGIAEGKALKMLNAGVDPALRLFNKHPRDVQAEYGKTLAPVWGRVHTAYQIAHLEASLKPKFFPKKLLNNCSTSLEHFVEKRYPTLTGRSLDNRLKRFVKFVSRLEMNHVLSMRHEFFKHVQIID